MTSLGSVDGVLNEILNDVTVDYQVDRHTAAQSQGSDDTQNDEKVV